MRGSDFLDKMALIDPVYIEAANIQPIKRKNTWIRWGALAACLCLLVGFVIYAHIQVYETYTEAIESFCLDESYPNVYVPISNEQLQQLGLQNHKIRRSDLGEKMGVTADCQDERLNGFPVYHFTKYPDKDFICIVDTPSGYAFYTIGLFKGIWETETVGTSSDFIFEAYKQAVINKAKGDAERFNLVYNAYKQGKKVTAKRLYFETMEDILSKSETVIIDPSAKGSNVLPLLPINK